VILTVFPLKTEHASGQFELPSLDLGAKGRKSEFATITDQKRDEENAVRRIFLKYCQRQQAQCAEQPLECKTQQRHHKDTSQVSLAQHLNAPRNHWVAEDTKTPMPPSSQTHAILGTAVRRRRAAIALWEAPKDPHTNRYQNSRSHCQT